MEKTELFKEISARAKAKGITMDNLCKQAGISPMTLYSWKFKVPKTLIIWGQINKVLNAKKTDGNKA